MKAFAKKVFALFQQKRKAVVIEKFVDVFMPFEIELILLGQVRQLAL